MRINRFVADASRLSRRGADAAITDGRVQINGNLAQLGQLVSPKDVVTLDGQPLQPPAALTVIFYKPVGVVTSRRRQGEARTIYSLLPSSLHGLEAVGRLDKDTSGLLILTSDGKLQHALSHPGSGKTKRYEVTLDRALAPADLSKLRQGIELDDGPSRPQIIAAQATHVTLELTEGRNRQVRRTFEALGYTVVGLHRSLVDGLDLGSLEPGQWREVRPGELYI